MTLLEALHTFNLVISILGAFALAGAVIKIVELIDR